MGSQPTECEWPATRVRDTFFKFFQDKAHVNWKSSPVVPHNDPTLLFANAGMNQFKPIFLGTADPNTELSKLKRACNTQKCIRAGGKHNDLDDVYKLPSDRIYATYFGGDEKLGLPADNEARDNWLKFLPANRVLPFGCKDNFWEMGDTGPCGPCTEIHFDRIGGRDVASRVNNDDPTVIEIWNLVFIQGIEKFKKAAQEVQGGILSGEDAFELWDTYGFPLDLTQLMAEERGLSVDVEGFNIAMDKARERSRSAQNKQAGGTIGMDADATASLHKKRVAATDDSFKFTWFQDHTSVIKAVYTGSEFLESVAPGDEVGIILETTSFYAEQGGQIYDTGFIEGPSGVFEVSNVQIYGGFVLHIGSFTGKTGRLFVGDKVICKVDYDRRKLIAPNHTCTHMLNFALREVLGNHVDQKGSIVLPEKLRYDFSHGKPVKPEELRKIESIVNDQIRAELDVFSKETRLGDAKRINGLRAVFGEVYPDPVRVVSIGRKVEDLLEDPENKEWLSISAELCGGTHISNTREAKAFALLSEEGIAKGIRRVTAVTTECAFKALDLASSLEQEVNEASKADGSVLEQGMAVMVISKDDQVNKAFICAGVPEKDGKYKQLNVTEWLKKVLELISGKGGGGKGVLLRARKLLTFSNSPFQGSDVSRVEAAMEVAESFAAMKLT
ncbi:UNVERIFIED_CONTAM: Alanine--tRNA ligase [Sesamum latifolium]|uniref:alanine--tRNA ligase n=1 Tax=Sesamum latifolium TaxID=2727402 RepID=A0AAW2XHB8_9LAMI